MERSVNTGARARSAVGACDRDQDHYTGQPPLRGATPPRCVSRRRPYARRCALVTLSSIVAVCAFAASPASAIKGHVFDFAFGEAGSGSGQLQNPAGIAINEESGNAYVVDQGNARIQEFSESGTALGSFTGAAAPTGPLEAPKDIAVDNSKNPLDPSENDIYVSGEVKVAGGAVHVIYKFSEGGIYLGQITSRTGGAPFGELLGVAVDTTGQLWAYQPSVLANGEVIHYTNALENELVGSCEDERGPKAGLAVDFEDNLYVNTGHGLFTKLTSSCEQLFVEIDTLPQESSAAAIDTQSNHVYLDNITSSAHFTGADELFEPRFAKEEEAPQGDLSEGAGIAVNSASPEKLVYIADRAANAIKVYREVIRPTVATLPASELGPQKATLNATVNPEGFEVISCVFEYGESTAYGESIACESQPGSGEAPVAVSAKPAGLQPGKTYHYRIRATNENGGSGNEGKDQFFTLGPGIEAEGVSEVSADAATFSATINPDRAQTTAFFEYGITTAYGSSVPATPIVIGEGEGGVQVDPQHVHGLSESTTYHFRVVALQDGQQFAGEDRTFTTQGQGGALILPDSRAWQLVSPPDKHGGVIEGTGLGAVQAAAAGNAVSYLANAPTEASPQGSAGLVQVLSTDSGAGWDSKDIASQHARATGRGLSPPEYTLFDEGITAGLIQPWGLFDPRLTEEASEQTPYLRLLGACETGCYRPLVTTKPGHQNALPGFGEERECEEENGLLHAARVQCGPFFIGASADLRHIVLGSAAPLSEGAGREQLYEWSQGAISQVSLLPRNEAGEEVPTPEASARLGVGFGQAFGQLKAFSSGASAKRAISADGSRVFWEAGGNLYVRDTALGQTLQLDKAETACEEDEEEGKCESGGGRFQIAAADGSSVLFTDLHRLTKGSASGGDLYECKIVLESLGRLGCGLSDLTPESGGEAALVQGSVLGASEDDSTLYFVAKGLLAANHNARGEAAIAGQPNLYVRRGGETSFVTRLATGDGKNWAIHAKEQPVRVSSNGRWLAFSSERPLTGYDNSDAASGNPDVEVYEYDASRRNLICASCSPSGARPHGVKFQPATEGTQGSWEEGRWVGALLPQSPSFVEGGSAYQTRALSDSGRVFFNAPDQLVPQDVNGTWDVYEREPAGVGGCEAGAKGFEGASDSCLGLISSGASAQQSAFLDASKSGADVFFLTSAQLTGKDIDQSRDVYDAHECTDAAPCPPEESVQPPPCSTEASCRPAPNPQPQIFGAPASSSFSGPGNQPPPPPAAPIVKPKKPTRHDLLVKALASCHKRFAKSKAHRVSCERTARRKYGPVPAKKAAKKAGKSAKGKNSSRGGRR